VIIRRRPPLNAAALELRERTARIRSAARKGKTSTEIAEVYGFPLKVVDQILGPLADVRLSDPADLLNHRAVPAELPAADVQVYWVGFLTATGRICGQGGSSALIVTLGDRSQEHMDTFIADLTTPQGRNEFCRSSLLGWQLYVRDQNVCKALVRWGIRSDLHGEDLTVLDDLLTEFIAPFLRGYQDGSPALDAARSPAESLVFYGTEGVLAAINAMIRRGLRIDSGVVTPGSPRAELKFNRRDERAILHHIHSYNVRSRAQSKRRPA
jgi:hypothetical protein